MPSLLISLLLWLLQQGAPNRIAERNRLEQEAERAFGSREYALAASLYRQLAETALLPEPAVLFNQAQAYFAANDTLRARALYLRLTQASEPGMAASALAQLGVLACRSGDSALALDYFRRAVRLVPEHPSAAYNFELLSKLRPGSRSARPRPEAAKTASPPKAPQPPAGGRVQPSSRREDVLSRLNRYNLSPEKARMLLDAMRAEEIQYIQQRRHPDEPGAERNVQPTW